jgi:predicted XRE-type DNA-binding protein
MTSRIYASVFDAIADTPQQAANLRLRAELMQRIDKWIERKGWTQREAAERCAITQPRMNDLLRGRLSRFSLDALVNIAAALGLRIEFKQAAWRMAAKKSSRPKRTSGTKPAEPTSAVKVANPAKPKKRVLGPTK